MTIIQCRAVVSIAALLLAGAATANAQDCTPITTVPTVISSPGRYCVTQDLKFMPSSGVAISIDSGNVVTTPYSGGTDAGNND